MIKPNDTRIVFFQWDQTQDVGVGQRLPLLLVCFEWGIVTPPVPEADIHQSQGRVSPQSSA